MLAGEKSEEFSRRLLRWRRAHNYDHRFLWRNTRDPYVVLISELFLRKTTRKQVVGVLSRFLGEYRNFAEIARARVENLEDMIRPLGMERKRAHLLKSLAGELAEKHTVAVPLTRQELMELPGVGPYATNAVLCLSAGFDEPLVDTNAIRVITRLFSYKSSVKRPRTDLSLWRFVKELIPKGTGRDFNLGLLDFAAEICTPARPKCFECPMADICDYYHGLLIFEKRLGVVERREHIIRIPKQAIKLFPALSSAELTAGRRRLSLKVDSQGRMNPSFLLWTQFLQMLDFNPGRDVIVFRWLSPKKEMMEIGVRKPEPLTQKDL